MFIDLLTGVFAFMNIACDVATDKIISKQTPPYKGLTFGYDKFEPCFPESDTAKDNSSPKVFKTPFQRNAAYESALKENKKKEEGDTFTDWVIENADMLSSALNGASSLIPYSDLDGVDVDKLIDFIFSQDNVESCEKTNDGIYILIRGG